MVLLYTHPTLWLKRSLELTLQFVSNFSRVGKMNEETPYLREFGRFRLDARKKTLSYDGAPVPMPLKELELLCVLIENRGELVTKEELLDKVWEDSFVEESNLSRHIYLLRKTFKDFGENEEYIQNIPRRGYRFSGEVRDIGIGEIVVEKHTSTKTLIEFQDETDEFAEPIRDVKKLSAPVKSGISIWLVLTFTAVAAAVITGAFFIWNSQPAPVIASTAKINSIAVLPMKSFSAGADDEELRLRITDALITRLGGLGGIAVRPTSAVLPFSTSEQDALTIGKLLEVDAVLDGRVQEERGRLRVTVQLIRVADGGHLWSEQFDGQADQILNLQDMISAKVSQSLGTGRQDPPTLAKRPTDNPEAYEAYLQGRYFSSSRNNEGMSKAVEYFQKAVVLDPKFAEAYAGLADTQYLLFDYGFMVNAEQIGLSKGNLQRALLLKPGLSEALVTLGTVQMHHEWDWANAERSYHQAIDVAPNAPTAHIRYGALLLRLARFDEAQTQFEQAIALDPLSITGNTNLGMVYFCSKDFAAAEQQFKKALEINGKFSGARWFLGRSLWLAGKKEEAVKETARALELDGNEPLARRFEERSRIGTPDDAFRLLLSEWEANPEKANPHSLAYLSVILGENEKAVSWLEKSFEDHHPWTLWIKAAPEFQLLADEPRYKALLQRMNMAD